MRETAAGFTGFQLSGDGKRVHLATSGKLFVFEREGGKVRELRTSPGVLLDPKFSPDGKLVSFARDHDVLVYDLADDEERAVTSGGTREVSHGIAEFVAQEEMHRFTG